MNIINAEVIETGEYARQGMDVRPYLIAELARAIDDLLIAHPDLVHVECSEGDVQRDQRRLRVTLRVIDAHVKVRERKATPEDFHNFDFRF